MTEEEFSEIYKIFWKRLYGLAYNYFRDKATSQELVQEVFIKLWVKRDELAEVKDMEAYLFRCMKNKIYDEYDKIASQEKVKKHTLAIYKEATYAMEEGMAYEETLALINKELEKLPLTTQRIFRMSKFQRYTNNEIASELQLSAKAVEYHITQALKKLRIRLSHLAVFVIAIIFFE